VSADEWVGDEAMKAWLDKHGVFEEAERLMDDPETPLEMQAWWTRRLNG
jgi:hypothetical protein